jgi:hypothetical protein
MVTVFECPLCYVLFLTDDQEAAKAHEQPSNIGVESSDLQDLLDPEYNENPSPIRIGNNLPVQREEKQGNFLKYIQPKSEYWISSVFRSKKIKTNRCM